MISLWLFRIRQDEMRISKNYTGTSQFVEALLGEGGGEMKLEICSSN